MLFHAAAATLLAALSAGADPKADLNEELLRAASAGDAKAVAAALAKGADVNAKSAYGATALSFAADKGHTEVARVLIQGKADVNAKDKLYQSTPLTWAVMRNNVGVIKLLVEAGAKGHEGTLRSAATAGKTELVRALLETGKYKGEALDKALAVTPAKSPEVAELLKKVGAKPPAETRTETAKADPAKAETTKTDKAKTETAEKKAAEAKLKPAPDPVGRVERAANWPQFRGTGASGVADGQLPPTGWDAGQGVNVRWKVPVPGLAHSCPVVWGDKVFLTTAVSGDPKAEYRPGSYGDVDSVNDRTEHAWLVLCLDKWTGKLLWERTACKGVPKVKRHLKGSQANPTPATDGTHVVALFASEGMYCYDAEGNLVWKSDLGVLSSGWFYDKDYEWGFGSSPVLYRCKVIVQCDVGKDSFISAFDLRDGKQVWRTPREEVPSWGTPTVVEGPGRPELVTNATKFARGYDPETGKELWRIGKHAEITVPTPVFGQGLIFVTSGYRPVQPIYAIKPGASGDLTLHDGNTSSDAVAWSIKRNGPYMPTPVLYGEHLYTCANNGLVTCYEAKTGKQVYRERLGGSATYTASPVAADGRLYFSSEEHGVAVVKAGPKFEKLAVNPVGEVCMATPAISDGMIFVRGQHHLFAFGRPTLVKGPSGTEVR